MSSPWTYFDLADRETTTAGLLAWLLDPNGDHGLGESVLKTFIDSANILVESTHSISVTREASAGGRRSFDILLSQAANPVAVIEVKCKTRGSAAQLSAYAEQVPQVVRVGYGEWNFPELGDDARDRFPLVTLKEIGSQVAQANESAASKYKGMLDSFSQYLRQESKRFENLKAYYITENVDTPPRARNALPLGNRFTSKTFWQWFLERVRRERPDFPDGWRSKSQTSGVWCAGGHICLSDGEEREFSKLGISLSGPLSAWVHLEIRGSRSLFGSPDEEIGKAELRITGEASDEQRWEIYRDLKEAADSLASEGFDPSGQRPSDSKGYWTALRKPLSREQIRYSNLVRIADIFYLN